MKKKSVRGRQVWLITCEGTNKKAEIIGIITARRSATYVKDFVERQYAERFFSIDERVSLALGRWKNPYPVSYAAFNGVTHRDQMICGGNPYIEARIVKIKGLENGELKWDEIPHSKTCSCWSLEPKLNESVS